MIPEGDVQSETQQSSIEDFGVLFFQSNCKQEGLSAMIPEGDAWHA